MKFLYACFFWVVFVITFVIGMILACCLLPFLRPICAGLVNGWVIVRDDSDF